MNGKSRRKALSKLKKQMASEREREQINQRKREQVVNTKAFWQGQSFGAASPVRRIDPKAMLPVED